LANGLSGSWPTDTPNGVSGERPVTQKEAEQQYTWSSHHTLQKAGDGAASRSSLVP
jgi:hypothetical protein